MSTVANTPALLTAEEFFERHPNHHVELVKGVVREVAMPGGVHGGVSGRMGGELYVYLATNDIGRLLTNDTYLLTGSDPDSVRGMDVAYLSYKKVPKGALPPGVIRVAPELVVEVRSPTDAWTDLFGKAEEYFSAGVAVVVLIDPGRRLLSVCRPGPAQSDLGVGDTLTLPDILPGFSMPVARLFE
jgi:Uma2 family endonuclease